MTETETNQNLRLALEEANRWLRYIDNLFWLLSSFLMAGTVFAVSRALKMNGEDYKVVFLSIIMIIVWYWYMQFHKHTIEESLIFFYRANDLEKKLKMDVLPDNINEKQAVIYVEPLKKVKGKKFTLIMVYITWVSWLIWCGFFIEYICKNWYNFWHLLVTLVTKLLNLN